jgi:hypothetical protein
VVSAEDGLAPPARGGPSTPDGLTSAEVRHLVVALMDRQLSANTVNGFFRVLSSLPAGRWDTRTSLGRMSGAPRSWDSGGQLPAGEYLDQVNAIWRSSTRAGPLRCPARLLSDLAETVTRAMGSCAPLGDPAPVNDRGEGVRDDEDADTPGKGDPDLSADRLLCE